MELYSADRYRLQQLHRWLTLEGNTMWLGFGAFILPAGLIGGLLGLAALVFTPYMLKTLYEVRRINWIVGFAVLVGAPAALAFLAPIEATVMVWAVWSYVLIAFYGYCWVLRHQVHVWIEREAWEARYRHGRDPHAW